MKKILKISNCDTCPMCVDNNDIGYSCTILKYFNIEADDYIGEDNTRQAITPDWCPVKNNTITLEFDN
jgi:hypothetical protein